MLHSYFYYFVGRCLLLIFFFFFFCKTWNDLPLRFPFFKNNVFKNIFKSNSSSESFAFSFEYSPYVNLIFTWLRLNSFQNTAMFFILLVLSNSFNSRVTLKVINWFSFQQSLLLVHPYLLVISTILSNSREHVPCHCSFFSMVCYPSEYTRN